MRILLTGACGLVGRSILRAASLADEHEFVPVDISPKIETVPGGVKADILDRELINRLADGCDAIIHTAALHGAFREKVPNQDFLRTNVIGAENLFEAALRNDIKRLVFSSTLEVLCGGDWIASGRTVYDEHSPPRPDWIYPLTKHLAEEMGHAYSRNHGLEVVQLRYAWVRSVPIEKIGISLLCHSIADTDVAEANLLSATVPGLTDHIFLICPEIPFTQRDIDDAHRDPNIVLERHWPGSTEVLTARGVKPKTDDFWPVSRVDYARQVLGWRPKVTFEKYLRHIGWRPPGDLDVRPSEDMVSQADHAAAPPAWSPPVTMSSD